MFDTTFFPGATKYWHMGKLHDWDSKEVHVMAHVLHYGSSVFEGIRAYETERGPAIFRLDDHIDRLFSSAAVMNMDVPYTKEEIMEACRLVMRANELNSAYIRPNLFFGYGNLGLTPKACPTELTVGCWEWGAYLGEKGIKEGVHVLLLPWKRVHPSQINPSVKLGGVYAQSNIVATHARKEGYDEGLFLNIEGRVAEGPGENIILVKNGVVKTNDKMESVLEGLTRTTVLELAADLGYSTRVEPITLNELYDADEVFFTGTAAEVTPITRITDGRYNSLPKEQWQTIVVGDGRPGPVTLQLAKLYGEVVRGQHDRYDRWLTYVYDSQSDSRPNLNGNSVATAGEPLSNY